MVLRRNFAPVFGRGGWLVVWVLGVWVFAFVVPGKRSSIFLYGVCCLAVGRLATTVWTLKDS